MLQVLLDPLIPAKAGIQAPRSVGAALDSRLRGNERLRGFRAAAGKVTGRNG
jgi:hypothetical protein